MKLTAAYNNKIEQAEEALLDLPQSGVPLEHAFAPGVYLRQVVMPANTIVIGHQHKTKHFNVVLTGKAIVVMNGDRHIIQAPCIFVSEPGVRKVLYIIEEMRWATIHPTDETDIETLEDQLITKSNAFLTHEEAQALSGVSSHLIEEIKEES